MAAVRNDANARNGHRFRTRNDRPTALEPSPREEIMDEDPNTAAGVAAKTGLARLPFCRLILAALGAALSASQTDEVTAAKCRKKSARCDNSNQCCSKRCRRGFCYPRRK
jgi:hypothetical protein